MHTSMCEWLHHQFLRFCWQGTSCQFGILLLGLSLAPSVFTKTLAPLIVWLSLLKVQLYAYSDDLIVGDSEVEVALSVKRTIQVLVHAGFIVNLKKSELAPTQELVYIRARFHLDVGRLYLPEIRIQALTTCVRSFSKVGAYTPANQYLSLLGLMAATL